MITKIIEVEGEEFAVLAGGNPRPRGKYYGKSTDTKPTEGVKNADRFYEMDTQNFYLFDEETNTWVQQ